MIFNFVYRPPGGAEVHHQGTGPAHADRSTRHVRHCHLRHHRPRVLLGSAAQVMLFTFRSGLVIFFHRSMQICDVDPKWIRTFLQNLA